MMRLEEFTKHPKDMSKEELESYMLSILEDMNKTLDKTNIEFRKEYGSGNRNADQNILSKYSSTI